MALPRPLLAPTARLAPQLRARLTASMRQALAVLTLPTADLEHTVDAAALDNPALELVDPAAPTGGRRRPAPSPTRDAGFDPFARVAAPAPGVIDELLAEVRCMRLDPDDRRVALAIVACLDHDGYLRATPDEVARVAGTAPDVARFERALRRVQALDPAGIAARDLAECLLLQLARAGTPADDLACRLVRAHLPALARRAHARLAEQLGVAPDVVIEAARRIARLDPAPGRDPDRGAPPLHRPDVVIRRGDDGWRAALARDPGERLRLRTPPDATATDRRQAADAAALLDHLAWRRATLLRVTAMLVEHQAAFLQHGVAALRSLSMRSVADALGVAESTVSRAVAGKIADTPHGLVPLRAFFARATGDAATDAAALPRIRARIAALIGAEPPARPLSDDDLARRLLADAGVRVTRRTVRNHRAALGIPPADVRRLTTGRAQPRRA